MVSLGRLFSTSLHGDGYDPDCAAASVFIGHCSRAIHSPCLEFSEVPPGYFGMVRVWAWGVRDDDSPSRAVEHHDDNFTMRGELFRNFRDNPVFCEYRLLLRQRNTAGDKSHHKEQNPYCMHSTPPQVGCSRLLRSVCHRNLNAQGRGKRPTLLLKRGKYRIVSPLSLGCTEPIRFFFF